MMMRMQVDNVEGDYRPEEFVWDDAGDCKCMANPRVRVFARVSKLVRCLRGVGPGEVGVPDPVGGRCIATSSCMASCKHIFVFGVRRVKDMCYTRPLFHTGMEEASVLPPIVNPAPCL